jgi:hypothetical protein
MPLMTLGSHAGAGRLVAIWLLRERHGKGRYDDEGNGKNF